MERRLAAIPAADMVGYSRLIRADEEGMIAALTEAVYADRAAAQVRDIGRDVWLLALSGRQSLMTLESRNCENLNLTGSEERSQFAFPSVSALYQFKCVLSSSEDKEVVWRHHRDIYEAIRKKESETARQRIVDHMDFLEAKI